MRTYLLILIMLLMTLEKGAAQVDYPTVDSITYRLYSENKWKELAGWHSQISKDSLDYYYLDLRLGMALYERGKWTRAKRYFERALLKNPAGQVAPDYLFRIYAAQGFRAEADSMYRLLDVITAPRMSYAPKSWLSGVYLEAGRRSSNRPEIAGPAGYYYLNLQHKLSPRLQIRQSVMFIEQPLNWSDYKQFQYSVTPSYYFGKGWEAELTAGLISFRRDVYSVLHSEQLITHREFQNPEGVTIVDSVLIKDTRLNGNIGVSSALFHLTGRKKIHDFTLNLQSVFYSDHIRPLLDSTHMENNRTIVHQPDGIVNIIERVSNDTVRMDKGSTSNTWQIGGGLDYTFRLPSRWMIRAGLEVQLVQQDKQSELLFLPQVEIGKAGTFSLTGYCFNKGFFPVSMLSGTQIYNNQDRINSRYSLSLGISSRGGAVFFITGQQDKITDAFTGSDYKLNSLYIGAYIKR